MTKEKRYWLSRRLVNGKVEKCCSQCGEWLEENADNFYMINKSKPERGFSGECKMCASNRTKTTQKRNPNIKQIKHKRYIKYKEDRDGEFYKEYWILHKEEKSEYTSNWRKNNRDKCNEYAKRHRNHDITSSEERALLEVFDYQCAYCGMTLEEHKKTYKQKLHNDHVDHNGYNDLRNDVPSCRSCNSSKHQYTLDEWYLKYKSFTQERYNKIIWWTTEGYKDYIEDKPPYRIIREQNEGADIKTFHFNLWTIDEKRNLIDIIATKNKRKDLKEDIEKYLNSLSIN